MGIRPILFSIILLMGNGIVGTIAIAEDGNAGLTVGTETPGDKQEAEPETRSEKLQEDRSTTVTKKQKGRSIKMIVGGQSTDGLAKQVILPVDD